MTRKEIESSVIELVIDRLAPDDDNDVTRNASFVDDLGADSLDCIELQMSFEDEFSVEIDDDEAERLKTVGSVVDYIAKAKGVE